MIGRPSQGKAALPRPASLRRQQDVAAQATRDMPPFGVRPIAQTALMDLPHVLMVRAAGSELADADHMGYPVLVGEDTTAAPIPWFDARFGVRDTAASETEDMLSRRTSPRAGPANLVRAREIQTGFGGERQPWGIVLGSVSPPIGSPQTGGTIAPQTVVATRGVCWARLMVQDESHRFCDPITSGDAQPAPDPREALDDPWPLLSAHDGSAAILWQPGPSHEDADGIRWAVISMTGQSPTLYMEPVTITRDDGGSGPADATDVTYTVTFARTGAQKTGVTPLLGRPSYGDGSGSSVWTILPASDGDPATWVRQPDDQGELVGRLMVHTEQIAPEDCA